MTLSKIYKVTERRKKLFGSPIVISECYFADWNAAMAFKIRKERPLLLSPYLGRKYRITLEEVLFDA